MVLQFSIQQVQNYFQGHLVRTGGRDGIEKYTVSLGLQGVDYVMRVTTFQGLFILGLSRTDGQGLDYFQTGVQDTMLTNY